MVLNFELIFYMHGDMDEASPYEKSEVNLEAPNNSYIFSKKSQKLAEIFGLMWNSLGSFFVVEIEFWWKNTHISSGPIWAQK